MSGKAWYVVSEDLNTLVHTAVGAFWLHLWHYRGVRNQIQHKACLRLHRVLSLLSHRRSCASFVVVVSRKR